MVVEVLRSGAGHMVSAVIYGTEQVDYHTGLHTLCARGVGESMVSCGWGGGCIQIAIMNSFSFIFLEIPYTLLKF